jgi:hypothetical protein
MQPNVLNSNQHLNKTSKSNLYISLIKVKYFHSQQYPW